MALPNELKIYEEKPKITKHLQKTHPRRYQDFTHILQNLKLLKNIMGFNIVSPSWILDNQKRKKNMSKGKTPTFNR